MPHRQSTISPQETVGESGWETKETESTKPEGGIWEQTLLSLSLPGDHVGRDMHSRDITCKFSSESESRSVMSESLPPHRYTWNSPGQNTRVANFSPLQGILRTQGLNPGIPHCGWILCQLSHKGSPRIQECIACPFSNRSSWPGNRTRDSCIAG